MSEVPSDADLAMLDIRARAASERRGEDLEEQIVAANRALFNAGRRHAIVEVLTLLDRRIKAIDDEVE